jgi:hypothetical protein
MGNHRMGHCQTQVNSTSPRVLEVVVTKIQRQLIRMEVSKSLNVVIITTKWKRLLHPT